MSTEWRWAVIFMTRPALSPGKALSVFTCVDPRVYMPGPCGNKNLFHCIESNSDSPVVQFVRLVTLPTGLSWLKEKVILNGKGGRRHKTRYMRRKYIR
jgi:hypothetical protein